MLLTVRVSAQDPPQAGSTGAGRRPSRWLSSDHEVSTEVFSRRVLLYRTHLQYDEDSNACAEFPDFSIHTSDDVCHSLSNSDEETEQLFSTMPARRIQVYTLTTRDKARSRYGQLRNTIARLASSEARTLDPHRSSHLCLYPTAYYQRGVG